LDLQVMSKIASLPISYNFFKNQPLDLSDSHR
jgi:hypothetical protein